MKTIKELQNKVSTKYTAAGIALFGAVNANAAVDVAGVNTAIGTAETSAHSVGTTIIGVIAGLAVVTIIIGLVRKL